MAPTSRPGTTTPENLTSDPPQSSSPPRQVKAGTLCSSFAGDDDAHKGMLEEMKGQLDKLRGYYGPPLRPRLVDFTVKVLATIFHGLIGTLCKQPGLPDWILSRISPITDGAPRAHDEAALSAQIRRSTARSEDMYPMLVDWLCAAYPLRAPIQPTYEDEALLPHLQTQFRSPYVGRDHEEFDQIVDRIEKARYDHTYYARTISILQTSGSGKSRQMRELSRLQAVLSICLRPAHSAAGDGFPTSDDIVGRYLADLAAGQPLPSKAGVSAPQADRRPLPPVAPPGAYRKPPRPLATAAALIGGLFSALNEVLDEDGFDHFRRLDVADPDNRRNDFFEAATVSAKDRLAEHLTGEKTGDKQRAGTGTARTEGGEDVAMVSARDLPNEDAETPCESVHVFRALILPYARTLFEKLRKIAPEVKRFYLVFDECSNIQKISRHGGKNEDPVTLHHVRSLIASFDSLSEDERLPLPLWCLLLDTSSSISELAPLPEHMESKRAANAIHHVPPYVPLSFDRLARRSPPLLRAEDAYSISHLKIFGRPLWGVMTSPREILRLAESKLFLKISTEDTLNAASGHLLAASLAILGHRVCLDLVPVRSDSAGGDTASTMVSKHMRYLTSIEDAVVRTSARSEPILALAAMQRILAAAGSFRQGYHKILTNYKRDLAAGHSIDYTGLRGEFLCRLLIVMASDLSIDRSVMTSMQHTGQIGRVSVDAFMTTLLGQDKWHEIQPQLLSSRTRDWTRCWLNMTHIACLPTSWKDDFTKTLLLMWLRSAAIQCAPREPGIDGVIPVYCGDLMQPPTRAAVSYIAWQAKLTASAQGPAKMSECMHGPKIGAGDPGLFTVLFDLGAGSRPPSEDDAAQADVTQRADRNTVKVHTPVCKRPPEGVKSKKQLCPLDGRRHSIIAVRGTTTKVLPFTELSNTVIGELAYGGAPPDFFENQGRNEDPAVADSPHAYARGDNTDFDHLFVDAAAAAAAQPTREGGDHATGAEAMVIDDST